MGTRQDFRCGDCGHGFSWITGDGHLTQVAHCRDCGIAYALPRLDDGPPAPQGAGRTDAPDGAAEGQAGRPAPPHHLRTHCHCGGELVPDAPIRCGRCLGVKVTPEGPACAWE